MSAKQMVLQVAGRQAFRGFAATPAETVEQLKKVGITNKNIVYNPT